MDIDDPTAELRAALVDASTRTHHPQLPLSNFVAELPDDIDDAEGQDSDDSAVPEEERDDAHARRGALLVAANTIIDRCISDLQWLNFSDGVPDPTQAEETFVFERFPKRHRRAYTELFFRKVLVCATKVAHDLVDPHVEAAACTAEEILRRCIAEDAIALCDEIGLEPPWLHPDNSLLEDFDFETLYEDDMDGVEDDPAHQAAIGLEVSGVDDWFTPFNPHRIVHPYAATEPSERGALHNLRQRLRGLDEDAFELLRTPHIDAPEPIGSLAPHSETVALARHAADPHTSDLWIADQNDPETSFTALVEATKTSTVGSGWLTWEPHEDAGLIREDAVIMFEPHRHFPVGPDEPYADASLGSKIISIPLSVVVSYRPDPTVRQRWNNAFSALD